MRTTNDNNKVVDLKKVQWASLTYWNQHGNVKAYKPITSTVFGETVRDEYAAYHPSYPQERMLERATRLGILDVWIPHLTLQLTANHQLVYTGEKALSIWKAWQSKIYGAKKKDN